MLISNLMFGQINPKKCIAPNKTEKELTNNPEYELIRQNLINYYQENQNINDKHQSTIIIPVVVHVVHRISHTNIGTATNISDAQIYDQIQILNEDYSKTNPEIANPPRNTFVNYAGSTNIKFCLATIDPLGNPTTGITRTASSKNSWDADDDDDSNPCYESDGMKRTVCGGIDNWDPLRYLNIWVCNLTNSSGGITAGYAYLPGLQSINSQKWKDGPVIDYQYFGTTSSSDGRTATHEIGHYLGLRHTFCETNGCCDNDNTFFSNVNDTPPTNGVYYGPVNSNTNNNTCNDLQYGFSTDMPDMDENYMSYAQNTWMFSQGQVDLMQGTLDASTNQGGRRNLWQNSTLITDCETISNTSDLAVNTNLRIYPNPTKGDLFINTSEKILNISTYNIVGEKIISNLQANNNIIDVSKLTNGVYFIKIHTVKGVFTKKVILSK